MNKLIQKVAIDIMDAPLDEMYIYGEATLEENLSMQEPLEKLYKYENHPDMREKVKEYISELETEIKRLEDHLEKYMDYSACKVTKIETRIGTLLEVINDLKGRLEEMV